MKELTHAFLLSLTLLVVSISCNSTRNVVLPAIKNGDVINIDLDSATKEGEVCFSDFLEAPKTIVLETKDNCVIKNIYAMDIYDNKFYILDNDINALYVFSIYGKYLFKIGAEGNGHGEYLQLSDFSIDRKDGIVYAWDEGKQSLLRYNANTGKFIDNIKTDDDEEQRFCMQYVDGKIYLNRSFAKSGKNDYLLDEIDVTSGEAIGSYLRASEYNKGWDYPLRLQQSFFYCRNTGEPRFAEIFSDTIIGLSKDGIRPCVAIKSKDFVTKDDIVKFKRQHSEKNKDYDILSFMKIGKTFLISKYIECNWLTSFEYMSGMNKEYLLYDKRNGHARKTEMLSNDFISKNYPFPAQLSYSDSQAVVSVLDQAYIPHFVKEIVKTGKLNRDIDGYSKLVHLNENSNPVLFYHKLKE